MGGTCAGYDSGAQPEVRKLLKREGQVPDDACLLADCLGKHCSKDGPEVCHYAPDGKKKPKRVGGKPRLGLRPRPRRTRGAAPFSLAAPRQARPPSRRRSGPRRKG
jgi:hypothetical protein